MEKITLYGQDDRTEGVYCSGHGVYWIAQDATSLLSAGENTISVTTSKGEAGSKIDGRVYAVMVVAAVEKDGGDVVRYIVLEGNENLHGEGWAGTNPTRRDRVEVPIGGMATDGVKKADLSVFLVATNRGQPDYVLFNGADLGVTPAKGNYRQGAKDIGNEQSFDAAGGEGFESRYVDRETFDVTGILRRDNVLVFERGRDLDGDGNITTTGATPEGEDYVHPCLAILTAVSGGPVSPPGLSVGPLEVRNAYAGERAEVTAVVSNTGATPDGPVTVALVVDGTRVESRDLVLPPAGRATVSLPWDVTEGTHVIAVEATAAGAAAGRAEKTVKAGTPVDLVVSVGQPVRKDGPVSAQATTPFPLAALAGGSAIGLWLSSRRPRIFPLFVAAAVLVTLLVIPVAQAAPATGASFNAYVLEVTVKNTGGSDSPAFSVTVLLDGEKVAKISFAGVPAGEAVKQDITIHTTPGRHAVSVIADEEGTIPERVRGNNRADATYDFP
jgi:subtilase family serine protease